MNPASQTVANSGARLYIEGSTYIEDDVTFGGIIKCVPDKKQPTDPTPAAKPGVNGVFSVETGGWKSSTLTFVKGILVNVSNGTNVEDLAVNAISVSWNDINNRPSAFPPESHDNSKHKYDYITTAALIDYAKKSDLVGYATTTQITELWDAINALSGNQPGEGEGDTTQG